MALVSLTPLPEIVISSLYVLLLTLTLSTMTDIFVTDTVAHLPAVTAALLTDTVVTRLFCYALDTSAVIDTHLDVVI